MKTARVTILAAAVIGMFLSGYAFSQVTGDYRSVTTGNWSEASTWETFDGTNWVPATSAPTGTETITVRGQDTVRVDVAVSITGYVKVEGNGVLVVTAGSLEFGDGSTYEHARDAGSLPTATWGQGSTFLLTGTVQDAPANRNQNFYHVTFNTPNLGRNRDMGWKGITIGGNVRVISTGAYRWQMTTAAAGDTAAFTIMGDVIVEAGQFSVQGTSNALTTFIVHHYGNINVTGGNFSIARGSQGNGSGTTTWYLYEGNFSMSNATTQNSNPTPGNAKLVFAKNGTQQLTFENVTYAGGQIHFEVTGSTTLQITKDFIANGNFVNRGTIEPLGTLTFTDGSVYEHARDGGTVPTAVWEKGSTALFTGITGTAPNNRGQDYYNLTLNTPGLTSNRDLSLNGHTIGGNIRVINTGSARWQMVGGVSGTVTIMGDVIVEAGQFATQGTGSATNVVVDHYGHINVTGGNFSISRGSQGNGAGTTIWYLHEGNFSMSNATTQNSNPTPGNAKFVFAKAGTQTLSLGEGNTIQKLPLEVSSGTTLDVGLSVIGGSDVFILKDGATLVTAHPQGVDGNLQTTGPITLGKQANYTFNGTEAQFAGLLLPDSVNVLTISNLAGVSFNDTLWSAQLMVLPETIMRIDSLGSVTADSGLVAGTVVNKGLLEAVKPLQFSDGSVYEHARDGGSIPSGVWNEGSTLLMTGTVNTAPDNRNQSYYNITFNTPQMLSNRDMGLDDVTIGGNIRVVNTGSARWRLTTAAAGDTAIVTIMGDVIVEGGSFETQGTSNALTVFEVHHYGNVVVTGGNFSVARGSQGNGSGSTRWYLHQGNFSMSNATTQNSNPTNAWFVFDKDSVQTLTLSSVTYGGGGLAIEVARGTTLDFGLSELGGSGLFMLDEGATLATAHANGIAGAVQSTGTLTFNEGANYIFNGTTPQVTSTLMPKTVNNLTIDNEAGVKLSQETTINGVLRLVAGEFDNTIPFTLGPNGSISYEGGHLKVPVSVIERLPEIPTEFALFQNYPNPFNPSTTIRFDIPKRTHISLKIYDVRGREVAELVDGEHEAGAFEILWNAQGLASGVYYYRISAGDFTAVRKLVLMK
ncbi:MAG: T9SS type A sorting domain-containing protein [candidate division KSB1 bacterium]|nr:T9SS type A sorting domain-containing protein [candidate division KSB1 bacterium]